jgi:rare lipoprotein A
MEPRMAVGFLLMARASVAVVCATLFLPCCAGADLPPASQAPAARRADPPLAAPARAPVVAAPETGTRRVDPEPSRDGRVLEGRYASQRALQVFRGQATYYGAAFEGRSTASGEPFDPLAFTAAHRSLPFGTIVRVVCPSSRQVVYVRINDRGPFGSRRRIIDLSRAAAERLDILRMGVADVRVEVVELGKTKRRNRRR